MKEKKKKRDPQHPGFWLTGASVYTRVIFPKIMASNCVAGQ